jgi:hypothetical protein
MLRFELPTSRTNLRIARLLFYQTLIITVIQNLNLRKATKAVANYCTHHADSS